MFVLLLILQCAGLQAMQNATHLPHHRPMVNGDFRSSQSTENPTRKGTGPVRTVDFVGSLALDTILHPVTISYAFQVRRNPPVNAMRRPGREDDEDEQDQQDEEDAEDGEEDEEEDGEDEEDSDDEDGEDEEDSDDEDGEDENNDGEDSIDEEGDDR